MKITKSQLKQIIKEELEKLQEMHPERARELGGAKMATPTHQKMLQQTIDDARQTLELHDSGQMKLPPHVVQALAALVGGAGHGSQPELDLDEPMYETLKEDYIGDEKLTAVMPRGTADINLWHVVKLIDAGIISDTNKSKALLALNPANPWGIGK